VTGVKFNIRPTVSGAVLAAPRPSGGSKPEALRHRTATLDEFADGDSTPAAITASGPRAPRTDSAIGTGTRAWPGPARIKYASGDSSLARKR